MTADVRFDEAASRLSTSQTSDGSVLQQILRAATHAGLDPVPELYNEALALAHDGHYGQARGRLEVLLGLAPSDGEAHLLLARVHVAGQQWRRALGALDQATQCGVRVPDALRDAVTRNLQHEVVDQEDVETREVRELAEATKLKSDVRRLRSENAHLVGQNRSLGREARRWAWVATITSVVAMFFVIVQAVTAGDPVETPIVDVAPDPTAAAIVAPAEANPTTTPAQPTAPAEPAGAVVVRDPGMKATVEAALADADLTGLSATVRGSTVSLSGTVGSHKAAKDAEKVAAGVSGIDTVDAAAVVNLARRDGVMYTVSPGDSLSVIAYRMYGNQTLSDTILKANPQLGGSTNLSVGQTLHIPAIRD